ncbi:Imm49 family immunity protein [Archangium violaceum]|uniref:Imm49 family immunity protein n=1 Tax=Archangium violaceum TaxID=83451 RepID=UPI000698DC8F|nr:Imm49 family immunity protein [Archangium violaceum]
MDTVRLNINLMQLIGLRRAELRNGDEQPQYVLELSRMYRRLGCGLLLSEKDAGGFFSCLYRAADLYLQFLERHSGGAGLDPYYMARGRAEPLLDALAIGDVALARRIDALAATTYREGMEYEEDFWFFSLLPKLASAGADEREALEGLEVLDGLDQMEQALQGISYPRYDILLALAREDARGFERALKDLTGAWMAERKREAGSGLGNPYAGPEAGVFVEGVALVRVARVRGLRIREKYRLIPAAALSSPRQAFRRQPLWKRAAHSNPRTHPRQSSR